MRVRIVNKSQWTICVILSADGKNPLLEQIPEKVWNVFSATLENVSKAEKGPAALPPNRNHLICEDCRIWQLSAAHPFRTPYFYQPDKFVIITHVFEKLGGKKNDTPKVEIARARELKAAYDAAKLGSTLVLEAENE